MIGKIASDLFFFLGHMLPRLNPFTGSGKGGDQRSTHMSIPMERKNMSKKKREARSSGRIPEVWSSGEALVKIVTTSRG